MSAPGSDPQERASNPDRSAWVSANAGSGKTTVLARRVIRLLLRGVHPAKILCLTYTKAAAANMANKVLGQLAQWVRLSDAELDEKLKEADTVPPDADRRALARRLFADALETPGGLKVQTIHAFCDRVLHMFPIEADVPVGFEVLDAVAESDLLHRARLDTLQAAAIAPGSAAGQALQVVLAASGDEKLGKTLGEAVRVRDALTRHDPASMAAAIRTCLSLSPGDTPQTIELEILDHALLPRSEWRAAGEALMPLGGNATTRGKELIEASASFAPLEAYLDVFFTEKRTPRTDSGFGKKEAIASDRELFERLFTERDRLAPLFARLCCARECERSLALFVLAREMISCYETLKRVRGKLDFADLVERTVALFADQASAWVHFKLDGGIEHILVDEAQDTSPEQWEIVAKLSEEFFAGLGAHERPRTIFVVGDEKQSIFSFQGADPARFDEMRREFVKRIGAGGGGLDEPQLNLSYRSVEAVLGAVDKVFSVEAARRGLVANDSVAPQHDAERLGVPGLVEIWQPCEGGEVEASELWDAPVDNAKQTEAPAVLARHIAEAIQHWTQDGAISVGDRNANPEGRRAVTPGDIVVLVRSRGGLFDAILRALKQRDIPVAGADRLELTSHLAVLDLMALGDAALLERDDLQLACALKSPLFGLSEDDLFVLAQGREGTLAAALLARDGEPFASAARKFSRWRNEARRLRPFDFYSRVLGRDGGRRKILARLGPEAADVLDEFLARTLSYEPIGTPSLQGFLAFLRRTGAEIKRDLDTDSRAVRVMTVHGVKGLEAPVVVLADTITLPVPQHDPALLAAEVPDAPPGSAAAWLWAATKDHDSSAMRTARAAAQARRDDEYRRLLYVALTRASDVLVVAGALGKRDAKKGPPDGSWYRLVRDALEAEPDAIREETVPYHPKPVRRWRGSASPIEPPAAAAGSDVKVPEWLSRNAPAQTDVARVLVPSRAVAFAPGERAAASQSGALERGRLLHRLLQSLPGIAATDRVAAAQNFLARHAPGFEAGERERLAEEALTVLDHPACAELFLPGSRAEVECLARLTDARGRRIDIPARIDRLAIGEREALFADFKSDAKPPARLEDVPDNTIAQLAIYRRALEAALPGRTLRALLIYTAGPKVLQIPAEMLDRAWLRLEMQPSLAGSGFVS